MQKEVPLYKLKKYSECVYDKFIIRYKAIENFPKGYYNENDNIDMMNCFIDILPDSINKDSLRLRIKGNFINSK